MQPDITFLEQQRRRKVARYTLTLSILAVLIAIMFIVSMNTGYMRLTPFEVLKTLFGSGTPKQELVLFEFRLPRIVISILIGAGLAVSGCILQGVSRNALADPGILGINAGAGLAVVLYVTFMKNVGMTNVFLLPFLSLVGAGMTAALIFTLAYKRHQGLMPIRLILVGIAVAAGISAAMIVLTLKLDPQQYQFVQVWMAGSIWGTTWKYVLAMLPWIVVLLPYVFFKARIFNVLQLGDHAALGLGTPVERERLKMLSAAVALAAACVAAGGAIGFVGLIGPHLARRLVGPSYQVLLPASAMAGALLVITADTIGRWIIQPSEVPTGIVVAVIGAPYFLYLLAKSRV